MTVRPALRPPARHVPALHLSALLSPALLAMAALHAAPAPAQIGRAQGDAGATLQSADTNKDGIVTRAEFNGARIARFAQMDRNGDGFVSRDDFRTLLRLRPQAGQRLDSLLAAGDANHDGRLSREEQLAAPMPLFERVDANRDGKIDAKEMAAARENAEALRNEIGAARN
jgi:hypothetical protein